ncbi:GntR family transcriptional regulator [Maridesulfovibrio bastinii]|uniref:GntR family transcriptional regulator n=1 Tax=Maridesulfovibrio bastinii TaxID=47157 RepID=UPI0004002A19|nr:GntR family transcriptional regulator [Maridesulfovibrio bastinii]
MEKQRFYQIVRQLILDRLKSGELKHGDKLPSERELCSETGINRNTVRHALTMLQREGKIYRLDRRGWYVTPTRLIYDPAHHVNFAKLASKQGRTARWTTRETGSLTIEGKMVGSNQFEGFKPGTPVDIMENIFFLDGQKVAYTQNYLHAKRLENIIPKTREEAMTQVIENEYGIKLEQRDLIIRPQFHSPEISNELDVPPGSPGMYIRRIKTDEKNIVLTVEHEYWRFDAIELRVKS